MPIPKGFRVAGQAIPVLNQILDTSAIVTAFTDPLEPRSGQRLLNTAAQGVNLGLGAATLGMDVIPTVAELLGVKSAAHLNPEAQLRRAAYLIGQRKDIGTDIAAQDAAVRELAKGRHREPVYTPQQVNQIYSRGLGGMF